MPECEWLIWSIEHNAWWKPNECGYTQKRAEAGRYEYTRAVEIVAGANIAGDDGPPNEAMVREADVAE